MRTRLGRAAHHRCCAALACTTPTPGPTDAIFKQRDQLAHTGTPRNKAFGAVGSTIHCRPVKVAIRRTPAQDAVAGPVAACLRTSDSTARSASVTGVKSGLVSMQIERPEPTHASIRPHGRQSQRKH